jgi:hypothetical protein
MTPRQTWLCLFGFSFLLLLTMALVAHFSPAPNARFVSATAVVSWTTGVAVGIERVLEAFWTLIGQLKGAWWPVNLVNEQVNRLVTGLDSALDPFYRSVEARISELAQAQQWSQQQIDAALKEVADLKLQLAELKRLAPDNQRVNLIAASASHGINYLETKYPGLEGAGALANQSIARMSGLVAAFTDNPGRRLISIYVGAILGSIVAGTIGLDAFQAALEIKPLVVPGYFPYWGVALTGVLMGLGSNPTHEVIRVIQEVKKSRKAENAAIT